MTTNSTASAQDIRTIENTIKYSDKINKNLVKSPCLLQLKSYLKVLELLYFTKNTNKLIMSQIIKDVLKGMYIFKDVEFVSKPHIIKASPNSDSVVIWVNI